MPADRSKPHTTSASGSPDTTVNTTPSPDSTSGGYSSPSTAVAPRTDVPRHHSSALPTTLPVIANPLVRVSERAGVEVVLVTVEAWPEDVVVRFRALPSELAASLEAGYWTELEAWHSRGRREAGSAPTQPAERIDFAVSLADDTGTTYAPVSSAVGGSGRMLSADWVFSPGPPWDAESFVVRVDEPPVEVGVALG
jgi:hypothetical protein